MSIEAQRVYLSDKVSKLVLGLPVKMPNLAFQQPKNGPWAEFFIMGTKGFVAAGAGEGKITERSAGLVQLNIWIPDGQGTKASAVAADKFAKGFRYKQGRDTDGSIYRFQGAETLAPQTSQGWSVQIVRIPFTKDEIVAVQVSL